MTWGARALFLVTLATCAAAEEAGTNPPAYPAGSSTQRFADLTFELNVPAEREADATFALVVILHGYGGTATGMAAALATLAADGFVVAAPKSTAEGWDDRDMGRVKEIVRHLLGALPIDPKRLHGVGFSNGGWNLEHLVCDESFSFASACWVAAGYRGAKVPKAARQGLGGMVLCGANDPNRQAAEETVKLLGDKLRSVECRLQEGLGHEWPDKLMPDYFHWLTVMDGRLVAGDDRSFAWQTDEDAARAQMAAEKKAGFIWVYAADDVEREEGKALQREVFLDSLVRRFGSQLVAIKLDRAEHAERVAELKIKKTPAIVVLKPSGKVLKTVQGTIPREGLGQLLRAVAGDPTLPE